MAKLASELVQVQIMHGETMEAQYREMEKLREHFTLEIEALKEILKEVKEDKTKNARQDAERTKTGLEKENEPIGKEEETTPQSQRSESIAVTPVSPGVKKYIEKRKYASVAASNPATTPDDPWIQVSHKNRKPNSQQPVKLTVNSEQQGKRILFPREKSDQQISEADLMLVLKEALQKAGERFETRFSRMRYAPSVAISALLTEKADAGLLIPRLSNVLIRVAKTVDASIVGAEVLEHWQPLKIHGMSLERYLGEKKIELLKRKVESSTGIQLKTLFC